MPLFSIITPVYEPPRDAFEDCVRSVLGQTSGDWEWCLANDASPSPWVSARLRELQRSDERIRVVDRPVNGGIVAASNDAIALTRGDFIVLLDNDDELRRDALDLVAGAIANEPDVDYVYSDEDKIGPDGRRFDAFAKPDWSPERLLAQNYTSHLSVLRRSIVDDVGRFRHGFDGSQDYDLVLRVTERARRIVHVREVLYHWRSLPTSTASSASAKPYAFQAALRAVGEHLGRRGIEASVDEVASSVARVRRVPVREPEVTIIVPVDERQRTVFGAETCLATNSIRSLSQRTSYRNYRMVLVAPDTLDGGFVDSLVERFDRPVTVVRLDGDFHRARAFNAGLVACDSRRAVLFDQGNEIIDPDWLATLVAYEDRERLAMVAPVILDADGAIVSAGLATAPEPNHIATGCRHDDPGPLGMFAIARECVGVATHCALVDVAVLKAVGGLSERFRSRWHDFDLANKLHTYGFHSIVTPLARIRWHGDADEPTGERATFESRWWWWTLDDPYSRTETRTDRAWFIPRRDEVA